MAEETSDTQPDATPSLPADYTFWHRILGSLFLHIFEQSPFQVKVEYGVAKTPKLIDIVVTSAGTDPSKAPLVARGIDNLNEHNLFTFKSHRETFRAATIVELVGYFTSHLKTEAPSKEDRQLDPNLVRLFAISTRRPTDVLDNPRITNTEVKEGVYDLEFGTLSVRLIVINELAEEEENAHLLLFSSIRSRVEYGKKHHKLPPTKYETLIGQLLNRYEQAGDQEMSEALSSTEDELFDFWFRTPRTHNKIVRRVAENFLEEIPEEERIKGVSPETYLKSLSPEQFAELARLMNEKNKGASENPPPENPST